LKEHTITLTISSPAMELLAELGYDPEMGARPLRRVIQQKVEDQLSDALLSGEFKDGDLIVVDVEAEQIVLRRGSEELASSSEAVITA